MKTEYTKDGLLVSGALNFDVGQTLECGQIFRFEKRGEGLYTVYSADKKAETEQKGDTVRITTDSPEYFRKFFDLDRDYSYLEKKCRAYGFLGEAYDFGKGIRILNQNLTEMIFSFIISANNNIKRIQLIIGRICDAIGKDMGGYKAFPTAEAMAAHSPLFFKEMGAGYRAEYLADTAKALAGGFDLGRLSSMDTAAARKKLLSLKGVGPKVADCILLFGLRKCDSFHVDTWIEKVYHEYFETGLKTREEIAAYLVGLFGDDAGMIQQYLFYFQREKSRAGA